MSWRVGKHYGIHVYEGDTPVATFHRPEDAQRAVDAVNLFIPEEFLGTGHTMTREEFLAFVNERKPK